MPILNYTTGVKTEKTLGEIMGMLVKAKAQAILTEYEEGEVSAVSFKMETEFGVRFFRLPANVQKILQVIVRDTRIPRQSRNHEQATRIAWRIVKDWLEVQLAMIEAGLVDKLQIFLPYMQSRQDGATLYEALRDQQFDTSLLLHGPKPDPNHT
jgi:hypothetical protein